MTLTLRAVSLNDQPLTQPITAHFDASGGTIGRSDASTLALPDPERHISRQQAQIVASGPIYLIKNIGAANPIFVRGETLAQGESAALSNHDQVRIGGYLLEVIDEQEGEATTVTRGRAGVDFKLGTEAPAPALDELAPPLSSSNPFADLIRPPPPPAAAWAAPVPPASARLPDDFDPFAVAPPPQPEAPQRPGALAPGAFGDLIPNAAPVSIDDAFGLKPGLRDPLAEFMSGLPAPSAAAPGADPGVPADPFAALFGSPPPPAAEAASAADDTPLLESAYRPPMMPAPTMPAPTMRNVVPVPPMMPVAAPETPAPARAPAAPPAPPGDAAATLWAAFCEGAGIGLRPEPGLNPDLMRIIGGLMRGAVEGILQLVAVRAATKQELRADVTMIQARNNNPMKFSPDARSALEQLLQPPMRGFLPGPAAMTETMNDLVGHSIGTMAGTRAALEGVLDRFAPIQLESKLSTKTLLDNLLPMNRKAKLWELYLQHFEAIRGEAQEDFHNLFGKAFVAAYEQQLDRLQRAKAATPARRGDA